jgi:serine/threonine protein kinase
LVHELDFNLPTLKYLAKGNYKIAWHIALNKENGHDEHYVMKTVVYSKVKSSSREVNRNTRDALIMERAGRAPISYENNVLPMYQYCAMTTIVPFATNLPLDKYIKMRTHLSAEEMYHLALQAARGLYQMHAYKDGKPTYVHADVKPTQFLLFDPPPSGLSEAEEEMDGLPVLQINDFNRGTYVTRSSDNEECAFQWCGIKHKGSSYRSPEEYVDCGDQTSAIDVFSLGGVFFYILSNGLRPYFHASFSNAVKNILQGGIPKLPDHDDYKKYLHFDDEEIDFVTKRAKHPLLVALQDVMKRCWSFNPSDRPTSLEVVQMLLSSAESVGEEATE